MPSFTPLQLIAHGHKFFVLLLLCCSSLQAQPVDFSAPVQDFKLFKFADSGFKEWDVQGARGQKGEGETIAVDQLQLRIFSGDETLTVRNHITAPQAFILFDESEAWGQQGILVEGEGFVLSGQDWHWYGQQQRIIVNNKARVTFTQPIGSILR